MSELPSDALQLRQVSQNLLANALKFTNPDRAPHITLHCDRMGTHQLLAGSINPAAGSPGAYYATSVAETGSALAKHTVNAFLVPSGGCTAKVTPTAA